MKKCTKLIKWEKEQEIDIPDDGLSIEIEKRRSRV